MYILDRKVDKVLDTEIIKEIRKMERAVRKFALMWKKTYRYTDIEDFRKEVKAARMNIIKAFTMDKHMYMGKLYYYGLAKGNICNIECDMEDLASKEMNVMSDKQWAELAIYLDTVNEMLDKLVSSLEAKYNIKNSMPAAVMPHIDFNEHQQFT